MKWIPVDERLPIIPNGKYGIQVLVAEFDSVFEEISPGKGYTVREVTYAFTTDRTGKPISAEWDYDMRPARDFMQLHYGLKGSSLTWGPIYDEITHWMYLPVPPTKMSCKCEGCEAIGYCNDSR